jgi:hypothetical protein
MKYLVNPLEFINVSNLEYALHEITFGRGTGRSSQAHHSHGDGDQGYKNGTGSGCGDRQGDPWGDGKSRQY